VEQKLEPALLIEIMFSIIFDSWNRTILGGGYDAYLLDQEFKVTKAD